MTPIKNHERDEEGEGGFKLINIRRERGEERAGEGGTRREKEGGGGRGRGEREWERDRERKKE